jgi:HK97 family phage prohead protease/HK97 family phage major capsid protein
MGKIIDVRIIENPEFKCYKSGPEFKFIEAGVSPQPGEPIGFIEGYASTPTVDSYDEIVEPVAFQGNEDYFTKWNFMLPMHKWQEFGVGRIDEHRIDSNGLWVRAAIPNTDDGRKIVELIRFKILKAMSIGFWTLQYEDNSGDGKPNRILRLKLAEISFVNRPANPDALFEEVSKGQSALQLSLKSINQFAHRDGSEGVKKMEPKDVTAAVEPMLAPITKDIGNLNRLTEEQGRRYKELIDKQEEFAKGLLTHTEFETFTKKIGQDILDVNEALAKAEKTRKNEASKMPMEQFHGAIRSLIDYRDDQGIPWSEAQKRTYRLMQMPFKKDGAMGECLNEIHEANDVLLMLDAMGRAVNKPVNLSATKTYGRLKQLAEHIDPDFAKSMYVGTGVGTEWVPTGWSSELFDLIVMEAKVRSLFPSFQMTQNPYIWPIKTSNPTVYRASKVSSNTPDAIVRSDVGTSQVTFTAELFAAATLMDAVLLEDAIISVLQTVRSSTATAFALSDDSRIINSDDTATHMDNASATRWAATTPETYEKGLRKLGLVTATKFDVQSTSTGVGDATAAFVAKDVRYGRQLMGVLGMDPAKVAYIMSLRTYFRCLNFTEQAQAQLYYLMAGTWKTGNLILPFDGCNVVVTSAIDENQAATGLYTDGVTSSTFTSLITVRPEAFKIGERRLLTLEFAKDISTQGVLAVTTKRESFQKMTPSTQYPVTVGYNIV